MKPPCRLGTAAKTDSPTIANDDNVFDFNSLLHPGTVFAHPRDVVSYPGLAISPDGLKVPVTIDEIPDALCALDGGPISWIFWGDKPRGQLGRVFGLPFRAGRQHSGPIEVVPI